MSSKKPKPNHRRKAKKQKQDYHKKFETIVTGAGRMGTQ